MTCKCADCGFLGLLNHDGEIGQVGIADRQSGIIAMPSGEPAPRCAVGAHDLAEEWKAERARITEGPGNTITLRVIQKDRPCERYTALRPGRSPKEHLDMIHTTEMLKFQAEEREKDRTFQEKLREDDRTFQKGIREDDRRYQDQQKRRDRRWQLIVAVLTALLAALLTFASNRLAPAPVMPPAVAPK